MLALSSLFVEGLLSFFSPCVLPLVPLYMAYLSNEFSDKRLKVFLNALCFVLGIGLTFVILGFSASYFAQLIQRYQEVFSLIAGVLIIIFGLHECGVLKISLLEYQWKVDGLNIQGQINYLKSFIFGFLFSFGWTPCIGPLMASALLAAATKSYGFLYLLVYWFGFALPFLFTGLFTNAVLKLLKRYQKLFHSVMIVAGVILLLFGGKMIMDNARIITDYKYPLAGSQDYRDMRFKDAKGNYICLRDYEGSYVFINFVTTWCNYCKQEIPMYQQFADNNDVVCLYAMSERYNNGISNNATYVAENTISLPIIDDNNAILFKEFGVNAYPFLIILGPDLEVIGYSNGLLDAEGFASVYKQAQSIYLEKTK